MVSYYNSLSYPQKHHATNLSYPTATAHQAWFPTNYHAHAAAAANQQFLNGMTGAPADHAAHLNQHHQAAAAAAMYYNSHMFHQGPAPPNSLPPQTASAHHDMYGGREVYQNYSPGSAHLQTSGPPPPAPPSTAASAYQYGIQNNGQYFIPPTSHLGLGSIGSSIMGSPLDETSSSADILTDGIPSPPNTTGSGGSGINSPGVPNASSSPHIPINRINTPMASSTPTNLTGCNNNSNNNNIISDKHNGNKEKSNNKMNENINGNDEHNDEEDDEEAENKMRSQMDGDDRSEYYDWMKKPTYSAQPNPGKTRTKDKYRVVYTDFQRLELEKEYHTSRYITIRRKTEMAQTLQLSERQVKIWFQNRRAKERKQSKKRDDPIGSAMSVGSGSMSGDQSPNGNNHGMQYSVADDLEKFLEIKPKMDNMNEYAHHNSWAMSMGPPPPPPHGHNMLSPFPVLPPHSHPHQAHHPHLAMSGVGQNGLLPQPGVGPTGPNSMQHAYSQMLQTMVEPIP